MSRLAALDSVVPWDAMNINKGLVLGGIVVLALGCTRDNPAFDGSENGGGSGSGNDGPSASSSDAADTTSASETSVGSTGIEPVDVSLAPLLWRLDCKGDYFPCNAPDTCFVEAPGTEHPVTRSASAELVGDPAVIYLVTLRLRGVVEPNHYTGGVNDGPINMGGIPSPDGVNTAYLNVSNPPSMRFVNATLEPGEARYCLRIDQELTIQATGGATVEIGTEDPNNCSQINIDAPLMNGGQAILFPDVDDPMQPHDGQFLLVEAVEIVRLPS